MSKSPAPSCVHEFEERGASGNRLLCKLCGSYSYRERKTGEIKPHACSGWTWINVPKPNGERGFRKKRVQWQCPHPVTTFSGGAQRIALCSKHAANRKSPAEMDAERAEKKLVAESLAFAEEMITVSREETQSMELRSVEPTDPDSIGGVHIW